ncbi:MAG TPA: HAD-IIB family hydrolase, partial [Kiloniellales bacterium]
MSAPEPSPRLQPLSRFPRAARAALRGVFFDIDDTLTTDGQLTAEAYAALARLHEAGLMIAPITGRPAGWCDHIARMWPVDGVVGENGAFYFRYDRARRRLHRRFVVGQTERAENRRRLDALAAEVLAAVPGAALASDQPYREADLAIDYREDVTPLSADAVARIVALFKAAGATAKVSSIHVNGWYGTYDKLSTTRLMLAEAF